MDPSRYIRQLYVSRDCLHLDYSQEIIERSGLTPTVLEPGEHPPVPGRYPENLSRGKQVLLLCRNRGRFFRPCPGTREYRCCDYQILNIGMNCPMDCVYCILQAYLNNPWLSFFVNIDDLFAELDQALPQTGEGLYRIGTGEFTDSLALDRLTRFSPLLVEYMRDKKQAVLELKTKSAEIDNLRGLDHGGRTIVAWSLNSPAIMAREEIRTASLQERLRAAAQCADWGYRLAFHFDPVILHPGWRQGYRSTIHQLFASVPARSIVWISLGALRYLPALKTTAGQRFPGSRFFYQEFVEGLDGKARYFRPQRLELYTWLVRELSRFVDSRTCIYFCMESDLIWKEVFGFVPADRGGLAAMLDRAVVE